MKKLFLNVFDLVDLKRLAAELVIVLGGVADGTNLVGELDFSIVDLVGSIGYLYTGNGEGNLVSVELIVGFNLYACNDTLASENGILTVKEAFSGEIIHSCAFTAKENASTLIATLKTDELKEKMLIFEWSAGEESGRNHYLCAEPPIDLAEYKNFLMLYFDFYMR